MRDQLLNEKLFYTLKEAQIIIERWRIYYNYMEMMAFGVEPFCIARQDALIYPTLAVVRA